MPPNTKGGKGYRKGKHATDEGPAMLEWDEEGGQMLGRVMKKLGDRRFRIFCNDNKERICKLCGSMRKSEWVDEGALVVIGAREMSNARSEAKGKEVLIGDILALIDPRLYSKLKKMPNQNPLLFTNLENMEQSDLNRKIKQIEEGKQQEEEDDGGIEFDRDAGDSSGDGSEWDDKEEGGEAKAGGGGPPKNYEKLSGKARDKAKAQMSEMRQRNGFAFERGKSNKNALQSTTTSSGTHSDAGRKNLTVTVEKEGEDGEEVEKEINIDDI